MSVPERGGMCLTEGSQNPNSNLLFCGFLHGTVALTAAPGENALRYLFEDCVLDTDRQELRRGADLLSVTPQVFDVLDYLIRNRERVVSKDDLIAAVWGGRIVSDAALTTRINVARNAIGDSGEDQRLIKTLPRKGFRFVGAVQEERMPAAAAFAATPKEAPRSALTLPDKPSIAVLPFTNLSSDPDQEYLVDGIVEDMITELSRFSELFVIARNSSFQYKGKAVDVRQVGRELGVRYVLEGSIRRSGNRIRVAAQLIDAETGAHRWAERYDRKLQDTFAVQDDVVRTIVTILAAHVRRAETERTRAKPPNSWQVYDYYLQGAEAFARFAFSMRAEDIYEARRILQQSLAIDANYARSYVLLANTYDAVRFHRFDSDYLNPATLDRAHQFARRAVELDPSLPEAHAMLGLVLTWMRQHDASITEIERAIALNPNYVDWRFGIAFVLAGNPQRAIDVLEAYMRLDPFHAPWACFTMGAAYFVLKDYPRALAILQDYASRVPDAAFGLLAATHAQLGQLDEARAEVAKLLRLRPGYTISGTARHLAAFKRPSDEKHFFDALRKAGLPE
jgi:adenylate cyclase